MQKETTIYYFLAKMTLYNLCIAKSYPFRNEKCFRPFKFWNRVEQLTITLIEINQNKTALNEHELY